MTLHLTHLDKVYWKDENITKGEMLNYYAEVATYMLPYLKDRPLVLNRFPEGISGINFHQKEAGKNHPSFVKTFTIKHSKKPVTYILAQNAKSVLYVANLGSIEFHPFNSKIQHVKNPDYAVMDLDPQGVDFDSIIDVALEIHVILDSLKIPNFCKTSGGRGLHIYIPLQKNCGYEEVKEFIHLLGFLVHEKFPKETSLVRDPKKREKKIYLDYLQNNFGQTLVAPYSLRARPHATVSTPLLWKEVKYGLDPQAFTIRTVLPRLSKKGDLFKGILGKGISIEVCLRKLEKLFPGGKYGIASVA
jgi:bifunctional non-homologous end joining protein LigD